MADSPGADLFPDWRDMIQELLEADVEFLVVGAFAVATYGHSRATKDIDLFIKPSATNARKVLLALHRFGAPLHGATEADFAKPGMILQLGVPPRRIDLITAIEGVTFEEAHVHPTHVNVTGLRIPVIGRKALIANKKAAGRHQDLADVEMLESGARSLTRKSSRRKSRSGR